MSEPTEDETSDRKLPYHHDDSDAHGDFIAKRKIHGRLEISETKSRYSGFVDEDISSTDPIIWGRLLPVDEYNGPGIDLADRHGSLQAFKPQGYIVGRDSECDLVIDHERVSNRHCLIYRVARNGQVCVFLRDLSSNGTLVNQKGVGCNQVVELKDRDEITISDSARFWFCRPGTIYRNFAQHYTFRHEVGKENISRVFVCQEKSTRQHFAVKKRTFSPDPKSDQDTKEKIAAELNLMGLCHRNIIFLKEAFAGDSLCFHVTQIAKKGDLFDLITRKSKLSEDETRHISKQLFEAVNYLHERNIVHRDLKPENISILDDKYNVVLCSFHLSITITTEGFDTTLCGSPSYVAPEILVASKDRKYGREVDVWSLGVVLYICLCGFPPFSDELYSKEFPYTLSQQIKAGRFDYPSPYWDGVGDPALDLIDSMLVVDPKRRFTIEQCFAHPWLTQAGPGQQVSAKSAPVLRRKPTILSPGELVPSSTYIASSKELHGPGAGKSPPDPMIWTSEAKGKGRVSSPLIKQPETKKQHYSKHQNIHGEPRRNSANAKMVEDIGNNLEELTLDSISSDLGGTAPYKSRSLSLSDKPGDSFGDSPSLGTNDFKSDDRWFSPSSEDLFAAGPVAPPTDQSLVTKSDTSKTIEELVQRPKASNPNSPMGRYSSLSGVTSRSLDEPLPSTIVENPNDAVSLEQAQETAAVRKSQEQKAVNFDDLGELEEKVEKSLKPMLSKALVKASTAVQLDQAKDFQSAWSAYWEACDLLHQVMLRTIEDEDKNKLAAIGKTYTTRIEELSLVLRGKDGGGKSLPQRRKSAAMVPRHNPKPSAVQQTVEEDTGSESEATSSVRTCTDLALSVDHNPFARMVHHAMHRFVSPWIPSTQLSEDLQNDIEFNDRGHALSTWTCTPSNQIPSDEIPLLVNGHPVVIPVEYKYPLTGMFSPPPDPHPLFISPADQISDEDIHHIFSTFPECSGFYLLVNGFLQIIMPDDFDYEEGVPAFPNEFGGLKVSLIPETVMPTAGQTSASSPAATTASTSTRFERMFGQGSAQSSVAGSAARPSANATGISVGSTIRAIVPGSKSKQRFEGKIGVAVTPRDDNSKKYVTIPTHLLTDAVIASKTMSLDSDTWRRDVKVCLASNSAELGEVTTIFDQDPKSFPVGFSHDVSLVDISGIPDTPQTIPYGADITWLSQQEWMDIKYKSSDLEIFGGQSWEAKSIGVVDSRCQMVGQGIFRIQQQSRKRSSFLSSLSSGPSSSRAQDLCDDPSTWTSLVARSILYRVHPENPARGGQSGVPVCVVSKGAFETAPRSVKVAGFASFVQMVSDVQKYDLEGDKLYKRLQEGRVAFYGAFQVPQELREGYQIL